MKHYNFKVEDLKKYIEYCIKNNYEKIEESLQSRFLYKNENNIAKISVNEKNNIKKIYLTFKENKDDILNINCESLPLDITNSNKKVIDSMLDILGFKLEKSIVRKVRVYYKDNVRFELYEYSSPDFMFNVNIDGPKEIIDLIYNDLKEYM